MIRLPELMARWRIWLIVSCAGMIGLYSLAVLYTAWQRPDLGLQTLLAGGLYPAIAEVSPEIEVRGPRPQPGDQILALDGVPTPTTLHLRWALDQVAERADPANLRREDSAGLDTDWVQLTMRSSSGTDTAETYQTEVATQTVPLRRIGLSLVWLLLEAGIFGVGALVFWSRPGDASAGIFFGLCSVCVLAFIGIFHWSSLVGTGVLVFPMVLGGMLLAPMTLHFYSLFPRPLPILRRYPRPTLTLLYAIPVAWLGAMTWNLTSVAWLMRQDAAPEQVLSRLQGLTTLIYGYLIFSVALFVVGQATVVRSYLRSRTRLERNQVRWLLVAMIVASVPIGGLVYLATTDRAAFAFGTAAKGMMFSISLVLTLSHAISITRYKLLQFGRVLNRGILYVGISFAVTAVFCLTVGLLTALVGRYYLRWEDALAAGLTAMILAVMLGAVRDRLQRAVDRRFSRQKYQLDRAMRRLGAAVDRLVEPDMLAGQMLQAARDAIGAEYGAVYLAGENNQGLRLVARAGGVRPPERLAAGDSLRQRMVEPVVMFRGGFDADSTLLAHCDLQLGCPLSQEGELLGLLVLGPRNSGRPYTEEDHNFLAALASTTTLALRSAQGHREIERLRKRLRGNIDKIAEQRRRISVLQGQLLSRRDQRQLSVPEKSRETATAPAELRHEIRGSSVVTRQLLADVAKVATSEASILVRGESGTGKELLARAVHDNSSRSGGPFVAVHCAALSPGLLESELFGHVRGAFTGADRDKVGRFEQARGGTLFLDEIGDINLETQTKLLRVLQERAFERVGDVQTVAADVRLITATHRPLEDLIARGTFREDLYYRLNVISLRCPPLRERQEDIYELALYFVQLHAERAGKQIVHIEEDAVEALISYHWPGNIRQLENAMQRAVVLAEGEVLSREDLAPEIIQRRQRSGISPTFEPNLRASEPIWHEHAPLSPSLTSTTSASGSARLVGNRPLDTEVQDLERQRIVAALAEAGGNKTKAAQLLGIPRSTLFSRLRRLGIHA